MLITSIAAAVSLCVSGCSTLLPTEKNQVVQVTLPDIMESPSAILPPHFLQDAHDKSDPNTIVHLTPAEFFHQPEGKLYLGGILFVGKHGDSHVETWLKQTSKNQTDSSQYLVVTLSYRGRTFYLVDQHDGIMRTLPDISGAERCKAGAGFVYCFVQNGEQRVNHFSDSGVHKFRHALVDVKGYYADGQAFAGPNHVIDAAPLLDKTWAVLRHVFNPEYGPAPSDVEHGPCCNNANSLLMMRHADGTEHVMGWTQLTQLNIERPALYINTAPESISSRIGWVNALGYINYPAPSFKRVVLDHRLNVSRDQIAIERNQPSAYHALDTDDTNWAAAQYSDGPLKVSFGSLDPARLQLTSHPDRPDRILISFLGENTRIDAPGYGASSSEFNSSPQESLRPAVLIHPYQPVESGSAEESAKNNQSAE